MDNEFYSPGRIAMRLARSAPLFGLVIALGRFAVTAAGAQTASAAIHAHNPDTVYVSLTEIRARALAANPDLVAARLDTSVARGLVRQAGVLAFNPSADALTGGDVLELGLSQEIEVFGQRAVRLSAQRAGLDRARASIANTTRLTIGEVDRSFYRLVAAIRRTSLAREVLGLNERLADVSRRQLAEGEISRLDYNLAVVELGRALARELATRREQEEAAITLSQMIGLPPATTLLPRGEDAVIPATPDNLHPPIGELPETDTAFAAEVEHLVQLALVRRADLRGLTANVRQLEAQANLLRREALPNLIARGVLERPTDGGRVFRPGLGLSLPIFNRNQGNVQALRAATRQAELQRTAMVTRVRAEVATAVSAYRAAAAEVRVLESTVLVPARQNRGLVETAYREGKVGLPELLLIQNQAIGAELDYWAAWLAGRQARATLAEATGQNVEFIAQRPSQ